VLRCGCLGEPVEQEDLHPAGSAERGRQTIVLATLPFVRPPSTWASSKTNARCPSSDETQDFPRSAASHSSPSERRLDEPTLNERESPPRRALLQLLG
jgi:hypothetical protein